MKTSVACCTYNGARFLGQQLRSVIEQTRPPDEIVVIDDVSRDDTVEVTMRFARDAPRGISIRIERNDVNRGVAANFERALSMTTGDVVFLCDQDDIWHADKVETMVGAFAARSDLLLLHSDARLIDAQGVPLHHSLFEALELRDAERRMVHDGDAFSALLVRNLATGATAALRRSAFDAARPFPPGWIHDEWLAVIAAALGSVDFLDSSLIDYRQHDANQIGMRRLSWPDKFDKLRQSRGERYATVLRRTETLRDRLAAMPQVEASRVAQVGQKLEHARVRATLPRHRIARLPTIARETMTGRYGRYSSGLQAIVRDCFEPA